GGKVYVLGINANQEYDPATDLWASRAPLPTPRTGFAAAGVDGKIYAIAGLIPSILPGFGTEAGVNEAFDPIANTWSTKASLQSWRQGLALGVIGGKIYAAGGYYANPFNVSDNHYITATEDYDPATDAWATRRPIATPRLGPAGAAA